MADNDNDDGQEKGADLSLVAGFLILTSVIDKLPVSSSMKMAHSMGRA